MTYKNMNRNVKVDKTNLNKAFRALRKKGYFAKQNFWCCQSCAWSAMSDEEGKKAVFYHQQDNDNLKENGTCHLAWAGNGKEIVEILNANGVKTEWEESSNKRIKIDLNQ